jgi:hypothetical protein
VNLGVLRQSLEQEIASYVYIVSSGAVGQPMPGSWVEAQLAELSASLVEPVWRAVAIRDTFEQTTQAQSELRQCVLVADDRNGHELYYDPVASEYVLAYSGSPPTTFNVRGDAVGCFMAR